MLIMYIFCKAYRTVYLICRSHFVVLDKSDKLNFQGRKVKLKKLGNQNKMRSKEINYSDNILALKKL